MKDHFPGELIPEYAWKNDLLNEQRKTNELLLKIIDLLESKPNEGGNEDDSNRRKLTKSSSRNAK